MKKLSIILVLLSMSSCKFISSFTNNVGDGIEIVAETPRNWVNEFINNDTEKHNREIKTLNEKLDLESNINQLQQETLDLLRLDITNIEDHLYLVDDMINTLNMEIDELSYSSELSDKLLNKKIKRIKNMIKNVRKIINNGIIEIINPCGDDINNDEIILKIGNSFIGYFENKGKRFLTELDTGTYRTTDKNNCVFRINNGIYTEISK